MSADETPPFDPPDPASWPRRADTWHDELIDAGVAPKLVRQIESIIVRESIRLGGEAIRRFVLSQDPRSPVFRAFERALLGPAQSLAADALETGVSKQSLSISTKRARVRLEKVG